MEDYEGAWRKELPALLKFAAPICVSQIAAVGMGMTDVIVAGNAGKADLAAVMIGSSVWSIIAFFFFGIGLANAPIVGRHYGVLNWDAIRSHMQQSGWLALACGLFAAFFVIVAAQFVHFWQIDAEVILIATDYLIAISPGAFAMAVVPLFRASLESMDEIHFVMKLSVATFVLNIAVDYWFVFGGLGLPAMGGAGCGVATSLVLGVQLIIFFWYLLKAKRLSQLEFFKGFSGPNWKLIRPTLILGFPIGLSTLMEIGFFGGMGLRMADIGVAEAGAHAVAINIAAFVFMFFIALGHAVTVRASHALGRDDFQRAKRIVLLGIASILAAALVSSVITYSFRHVLPLLFNQDMEVVSLAAQYLVYAALFQFFDGLQAMSICSMRAYKDTAVPSAIQFFAFWVVGMPLGIFLPGSIIGSTAIGSEGVWIAFCISLAVSSAILLLRLYWKVFKP